MLSFFNIEHKHTQKLNTKKRDVFIHGEIKNLFSDTEEFLDWLDFLIDCISYPTDVLHLYLAKEHGKIRKDQIFLH